MTSNRLQQYFFLFLFLGILALVLFIFKPFLAPLLIAGMLAIVFSKLYERMRKFVRGRDVVASLITTFTVVLIIVIPLTFFGVRFVDEATGVYVELSGGGGTQFIENIANVIERYVQSIDPRFSIDVQGYSTLVINWVVSNLGVVFSGAATVGLSVFLAIFALYYFLKDGKKFRDAIMSLSPLADEYDQAIFEKLEKAVNSVVRGSLVIAIIQGALIGLGFLIFGVPNAVFWGFFAVIASLIPTIGTAVITIPAAIYLFAQGSIISTIGILLWGFFIAGGVDNFVRPKLIERGIDIHPFLILLSVLGGLQLFGPVGFLLGPLVLSFLFALIDLYRKEFKTSLERT